MTTEPDHLTDKGRRTRARLLEAAEAELLDRGRIEVTGVANRAGVSLGLMYRYFVDKDELVEAIVHRFYDRYEEEVFSTAAPEGTRWLDSELKRIQTEVTFLLSDPMGRRIIGNASTEPAAALADARRMAGHIDIAARNIQHGVRRGEIVSGVNPQLAAASIIGGMRSCLAVALRDDSTIRPEQVVDSVHRISMALIGPVPG